MKMFSRNMLLLSCPLVAKAKISELYIFSVHVSFYVSQGFNICYNSTVHFQLVFKVVTSPQNVFQVFCLMVSLMNFLVRMIFTTYQLLKLQSLTTMTLTNSEDNLKPLILHSQFFSNDLFQSGKKKEPLGFNCSGKQF